MSGRRQSTRQMIINRRARFDQANVAYGEIEGFFTGYRAACPQGGKPTWCKYVEDRAATMMNAIQNLSDELEGHLDTDLNENEGG